MKHVVFGTKGLLHAMEGWLVKC